MIVQIAITKVVHEKKDHCDYGKMPPFPILGSENRVGWV